MRTRTKTRNQSREEAPPTLPRELQALGFLVAFIGLILLLGPIAAVFLFTTAFFVVTRHFAPPKGRDLSRVFVRWPCTCCSRSDCSYRCITVCSRRFSNRVDRNPPPTRPRRLAPVDPKAPFKPKAHTVPNRADPKSATRRGTRAWKAIIDACVPPLLVRVLTILMAAIAGGATAHAASVRGETVTLLSPNSAGGMMTRYARMIAPYIAKHSGARDVRVRIMTGGGGIRGANALWYAEPDGRTIAFTSVTTLILSQLAGSEAVRFDATRFVYLGRAATEPRVLTVGATSNIASVEDARILGRPFVFPVPGHRRGLLFHGRAGGCAGYTVAGDQRIRRQR